MLSRDRKRLFGQVGQETTYLRVASSNMSHLEPHPGFYRLFMKGIYNAYVL